MIEKERPVTCTSRDKGIMGCFCSLRNVLFLCWFVRVAEWPWPMLVFHGNTSYRGTASLSCECEATLRPQELLFSFPHHFFNKYLLSIIYIHIYIYIYICIYVIKVVSIHLIASALKRELRFNISVYKLELLCREGGPNEDIFRVMGNFPWRLHRRGGISPSVERCLTCESFI